MLKNKKTTLLIVGILLVISVITGISYALWTVTRTQTDTNIVESGCFSMELVTGTSINLETEFPITDEEGLQTEPFHFKIKNTCDTAASVEMKLLTMNETTMGLNHVKVALEGVVGIEPTLIDSLTDTTTMTSGVASAKTLKTVQIDGGDTREFDLRLWIDETVTKEEESNTKLIAKVEIDGSATVNQLYADHSGANVPELNNGLIPVVYQNNKWIKADLNNEWYDYDNQWWANAVTVKETNRSTYASAEPGTEIPMEDINTMWVWIPRYEYQTDNLSTNYAGGSQTEPGAININFVSQETTTASASNFLIHSAFTFGSEQLSGIWTAKFEMSTGDTTCTPANSSVETGCDITTIQPEVKPNTVSWHGARAGTFFTTIQNQMNADAGLTTYGITNSDTHMMKNIEWGAVAYLSQSKYGKYGNSSYEGANKEIYQNKSTTFVTGSSNGTPSVAINLRINPQYTYEKEKLGTGASTTGNIYGIYDMNGGAHDSVMGIMKESTNTEVAVGGTASYNSGFSGKLYDGTDYEGTYGALKDIDTKYYDVYDYAISTSDSNYNPANRYASGDATYETLSWYSDHNGFVNSGTVYFARGLCWRHSQNAGIFGMLAYNGVANMYFGSRPVLVAQPES